MEIASLNYNGGCNNSFLFSGKELHTDNGLDWYNFGSRFYDAQLARWHVADPAMQFANPYIGIGNNPVNYVDPDGELAWFVPVIIGAAIGGFSGYMIGDAAGAKGWDMAGYIAGGALIGGLSGGAAAGISAAGGGAMLAGAGAGAVGGAGFSGLSTGWDGNAILTGAVNGAIAGFVGGGVGSAIGGGWGALAGGASANLTSQLLYNDGDFSQVNWGSVAVSGAVSAGLYHGMSYASWKWGGGNNLGGYDVKYSAYCKMNAQMQRSRFWHREFGGYLMDDGSYVKGAFRHSSKYHYDFDGAYNDLSATQVKHVVSRVHTHWTTDNTSYYYN